MFFDILDSVVINWWILLKAVMKAKNLWNPSKERRYTFAWFKETVILSLCNAHTTRKHTPNLRISKPTLPIQYVQAAIKHQVTTLSQFPRMSSSTARCVKYSVMKRTAYPVCKEFHCCDCGLKNLEEMLTWHSPRSVRCNHHTTNDDCI